ncbi:MAG: SPFH domain-containing protein, partial [Acidobacteriota bacterium]
MIKEFNYSAQSGTSMLLLWLCCLAAAILGVIWGGWLLTTLSVLSLPALLLALCGFFVVGPNQTMVLTLFGNYKGSVRQQGLHWANPFMGTHKVSLRVRKFETTRLKVNDHAGNPIEIAAVV